MARVVTLLTDFGTADGYVGELKGVLASGLPQGTIVDIAHDLRPHDVDAGRLALARYWQRFPEGTIHLAVVDPGVGGSRAAIAVESEGRFLIGPDNGILSPALLHPGVRCVSLPTPSSAAPTFHGRDVFAPAAVELGRGAVLDGLGPRHVDPVVRRTPAALRRVDGAIVGSIITVDRFGNLVTNIVARLGGAIEIAGRRVPILASYSDVPIGGILGLTGSSGLVEVAVREGSAAEALRAGAGDPAILYPPS